MPYFFRKLGKMSQNVSSAAVVIGALRVKAWNEFESENFTLKELLRICARINGPVALN